VATDVAIISDESVNFCLWLLWSCGWNIDALSHSVLIANPLIVWGNVCGRL
jgi:hypothetical protein